MSVVKAKQPFVPSSGSGGGLTSSQHRSLDQLVHEIAETAYKELVYDGTYSWRINGIIWWTDSGKTIKIREVNYTYDGVSNWKIITEVVKQYDGAGILLETLTKTYNYTGIFITHVNEVLT